MARAQLQDSGLTDAWAWKPALLLVSSTAPSGIEGCFGQLAWRYGSADREAIVLDGARRQAVYRAHRCHDGSIQSPHRRPSRKRRNAQGGSCSSSGCSGGSGCGLATGGHHCACREGCGYHRWRGKKGDGSQMGVCRALKGCLENSLSQSKKGRRCYFAATCERVVRNWLRRRNIYISIWPRN